MTGVLCHTCYFGEGKEEVMLYPRSGRLWISHMLLRKPLPFHLNGYTWVTLYCFICVLNLVDCICFYYRLCVGQHRYQVLCFSLEITTLKIVHFSFSNSINHGAWWFMEWLPAGCYWESRALLSFCSMQLFHLLWLSSSCHSWHGCAPLFCYLLYAYQLWKKPR